MVRANGSSHFFHVLSNITKYSVVTESEGGREGNLMSEEKRASEK